MSGRPQGPAIRRDCQHVRARHTHGTHNAYCSDRCRCTPCRRAHAVHVARWSKATALGLHTDGLLNPIPAAHMLDALRLRGYGLPALAEYTGLSLVTLKDVYRHNNITRRTGLRILAAHRELPMKFGRGSSIARTWASRKLAAA